MNQAEPSGHPRVARFLPADPARAGDGVPGDQRQGDRQAAEPADGQRNDYWYEDPQPTSVHQIPRLWSWRPDQEPGPARRSPDVAAPQPGSWEEAPHPGTAQPESWRESPRPGTPRPGPARAPRADGREPRDARFGEPRPADQAPAEAPEAESWQPGPWESEPWQEQYQGTPARPAEQPPSVGPTAALYGRAGGPGFTVPQGAVSGLYDPAHRSGWQLAHGMWQDCGIGWEPEPVPQPEQEPTAAPSDGWGEYTRGGLPAEDWAPAFASLPLGAPTFADAPAATRPDAHALAPRPHAGRPGEPGEPGEPDDLYRAWQGSVRRASSRSARRRAWQVARVGVPAAVIVTVGAGAVMMLTGKTNEMLSDRSNQGSPAPGSSGAPAAPAGAGFAGYPGQHGTVTVSSIASSGGTRLAVGTADGHPAIWRRAADGTWTLVSASSPAVYQQPGAENLTSVAHGPAGWIAIGDTVSGAARHPVVFTSADGVTWQPTDSLAAVLGPGSYLNGVTAGRNGYVVVGKRVTGGRMFAGMWWSADLRNWIPGNNGGLDGRLKASTVYAVTAVGTGFIAAGTHGSCHAVWMSADGRQWSVHDITVPTGASDAVLLQVTVNGARVVAAGYAVTKAGDVPVAVLSTDGGLHWRQIVLSAPAGLGRVTALTAAGNGFVAAGHAGPAAAQRAVTWSSPDGLTWSAATPAGAGVQQITALSATGGMVTGTAQRGTGPSVLTVPAP